MAVDGGGENHLGRVLSQNVVVTLYKSRICVEADSRHFHLKRVLTQN